MSLFSRLIRHIAVALTVALVLLVPPQAARADSGRFELQVPVLYYHHVLCAPPDATIPSLYECPDVFTDQLTYLRDHGWTAITVDQLADLVAQRSCPAPKTFVISFDDGSSDGYANAAPIMESLGMRGTFFATLGDVGAPRTGKISFDQMRDLVARGHAIGNHSQNHLNLKVQTAPVLYEQIEIAQQRFESILGYRPRTFAYPYGRFNDQVIAQVSQSGFDLAFTVHRGARESNQAPFISKRIEVPNTDTGPMLLNRIATYTDGCRPPTPDIAVALSGWSTWKGDNVYASAPWKAQTVTRNGVRVGQTYQFKVRLQNDAQRAGRFNLTRSITGLAQVNVRYSVGGVDVTSAIVGGTFTAWLEPWSEINIDVSMTPTKWSPHGTAQRIVLRAASIDDATHVDVGRLAIVF